MVDLGDGSFDDRYAVLADLANFRASFLNTLPCRVSYDFRSYFESVKALFRSLVCCIACDLDGVFVPSAVFTTTVLVA